MSTGLEGPRATLNELKWRHDALDEATIYYEHRGAPNDTATASGADIHNLGRSFITLTRRRKTVKIPYHRVFKIDRDGDEIFHRDNL